MIALPFSVSWLRLYIWIRLTHTCVSASLVLCVCVYAYAIALTINCLFCFGQTSLRVNHSLECTIERVLCSLKPFTKKGIPLVALNLKEVKLPDRL